MITREDARARPGGLAANLSRIGSGRLKTGTKPPLFFSPQSNEQAWEPDKIVRKPGPLDDAEKLIMRTHCDIGYNMLTRIPFLRESADIVFAHREFFDGTGYPRGLRGEEIPLGARIISIANTLDAMLSDCPYRNALTMSNAREEIGRCAGTQFDPKIVKVFLTIPENHWIELRENLESPFRLTHLRNMSIS